jgi:hypothetical protein
VAHRAGVRRQERLFELFYAVGQPTHRRSFVHCPAQSGRGWPPRCSKHSMRCLSPTFVPCAGPIAAGVLWPAVPGLPTC